MLILETECVNTFPRGLKRTHDRPGSRDQHRVSRVHNLLRHPSCDCCRLFAGDDRKTGFRLPSMSHHETLFDHDAYSVRRYAVHCYHDSCVARATQPLGEEYMNQIHTVGSGGRTGVVDWDQPVSNEHLHGI